MHNNYLDIQNFLNQSKVVAFPTETVYGLAILYDDKKAYENLCKIKGRDINKPIAIMVNNYLPIEKYFIISDIAKKIINKFLPGPLTVLLKLKEEVDFPYQTHLGTRIVGIRMPSDNNLQKILENIDRPIQITSANYSGKKPCLTYEEVKKTFINNDNIGLIIKGECKSKIPTTIVDLTTKDIKIVREGEISKQEILKEV